jgi:hypothetical protein
VVILETEATRLRAKITGNGTEEGNYTFEIEAWFMIES